jgi:hypothetical protein
VAHAILFPIADLWVQQSFLGLLKRYITLKITYFYQSYSLIFFLTGLHSRKKKFKVYFSTGNKGVKGLARIGNAPVIIALTIRGSFAISFSCIEFR